MAHRPPNILFIMADQQRHDYLGYAKTKGLEALQTPHIDSIAARGLRFTHCCTNSPICAPARIALACGLQPHKVGALDNMAYLPADVTTYYRRLRDAGYRVGHVGKIDLAKPDPYNGRDGDRPCNYTWGFTDPHETEGKMHAGKSPTPLGPYGLWLEQRGLYQTFVQDYKARKKSFDRSIADSALPTDAFEDSYIAEYAAKWLREVNDDFPWHYFVNFVGPHDPFDPPTEYADLYRDRPMPARIPVDLTGKSRRAAHCVVEATDIERTAAQRQYCGSIHAIDVGVGKILAALKERGQLENTYIIFSSDHGEMLGDFGMYTKHVPYESALRVPLVVAGPGIAAGAVNSSLVELIDLNPTICDLAGLPPQEGIDARSLGPVLRGERQTHRDDIVAIERPYRLIRTNRWKYVETYNDTAELYDLQADPQERRNVAEQYPDEVKHFTRQLMVRTK